MVTAVHQPRYGSYATVRVVPQSVALGQQRCLTVQVRMSKYKGVAIWILPVGHLNLSSDSLYVRGESDSALSMGCSGYIAYFSSGLFFYGGNYRAAPVGFCSGDVVSAVVDRRTHSGNGSNGMVRFLRNGKALMAETEPLCKLGSLRRPCWLSALAVRVEA